MTLNLDVIYRQLLAMNAQIGAMIAQVKAEMPPEDPDGKEQQRVFGKVPRSEDNAGHGSGREGQAASRRR